MNFLRRSPIKKKPRRAKTSAPWRNQVVRLDPKGMASLRSEAFARSQGICECGREECRKREAKFRRVSWYDGQLHHVISRAHGGSDTLENVQFITWRCHREIHGDVQWTKRSA